MIILALMAALTTPVMAQPPSRPLIFVLAGQSNASGRGYVSELPPDHFDSRVSALSNAWTWVEAREPLDILDAAGRHDPWAEDSAGVGPGVAMGLRLIELDPDAQIVLVPCARGGSRAYDWRPGFHANMLYSTCLRKALYAAARSGGKLAGLVYYQGESDALNATDAGAYEGLVATMIAAFRRDTGEPDLPVLLVRLHPTSPGPVYPFWTTILDAQTSLDAQPGVIVVQAQGARLSDQVHLATSAQISLGRSLADAWWLR